MGMYCACGNRRNRWFADSDPDHWDKRCTCDLTGFVDCNTRLPDKDGIYEVRCQSDSCDIYHEKRAFSLIPKVVEHDGYNGNKTNSYHWEGEAWDGDIIMMWREVPQSGV